MPRPILFVLNDGRQLFISYNIHDLMFKNHSNSLLYSHEGSKSSFETCKSSFSIVNPENVVKSASVGSISNKSTVIETAKIKEVYADMEENRQLNQYQLIQLLGSGSFGIVYEAIDTNSKERVAIKEISKKRLYKRKKGLSGLLFHLKQNSASRSSGVSDEDLVSDEDAGLRSDKTTLRLKDDVFCCSRSSSTPSLSFDQPLNMDDGLDSIRREIAILKQLDHPNIVRLIEVLNDSEEDILYMVFELCSDGTTMDLHGILSSSPGNSSPTPDMVNSIHNIDPKAYKSDIFEDEKCHPVPEDKAHSWFCDLVKGVKCLHDTNIVHRDIKPDNLFLCKDSFNDIPRLKIGDFGVSEFVEMDRNPHNDVNTEDQMDFDYNDDSQVFGDNKTKNSIMKKDPYSFAFPQNSAGSPAFTAPELLSRSKYYKDCMKSPHNLKKADIWSMGITLYCWISASLPFKGSSVAEIYNSILTNDPDTSKIETPELRDILHKLLKKDPNQRITLEEILMHPWVISAPIASSSKTERQSSRPSRKTVFGKVWRKIRRGNRIMHTPTRKSGLAILNRIRAPSEYL